ncbi:MAG: patatin-like phospholipase family protein [Lysobacterales bacterium]
MEPRANSKTAFVFAGGGSFGAIQVGMLHALVAHGVLPDLVVGASVGAINCAYFAGNPTLAGVERLAQIWYELKRSTIFPMSFSRIAGLFSRSPSLVDSGGLRQLIEQNLSYSTLEQAALPLHVVATEQLHGNSVCLSSGPVVDAVLASCAIPAIFPPVQVGNE